MDRKLQYNVWMRQGNAWEAVLKTAVSQLTAETLAVLMAQERYMPYTDDRFCVSIGRPSSLGFNDKAVSVGGCVIDKLADWVLREMHVRNVQIEQTINGVERWHLLQQAGLVNNQGKITEAGVTFVQTHRSQ